MISVQDLYLSVGDYSAKYQSGRDIMEVFNRNLAQTQLEIISDLSPHYSSNQMVKNLLDTWVKRITDIADEYGVIIPPGIGETVNEESGELFMRPLGLGVTDSDGAILYEMYPIAENEIAITHRIPQRSPSLTKKRVYWLNYDSRIQLYPSEAIPFIMFYFIYPLDANIAFRFYQDPDTGEYVQEYDPDNSIDLSWDPVASNLFLYKMLQKYGVENREMLILEFAKFGVDMTLALGGGGKA